MRVSVVIPALNEQSHIEHCLASPCDQETPADEIIVVDNGSTDRTIEIAGRFPVRVIHEARRGIAFARNAGFDAAAGDIIARTDADTCVPRDWVRRIRERFQRGDCDALGGTCVAARAGLRTTLPVRAYFAVAKALQGGRETMLGSNMAVARSMWRRVRSRLCTDDLRLHEDVDFALHVHAAGGTVVRDNSLIVYTSVRRMLHHPWSFFVEYPLRFLHTVRAHRRMP